MHIPKGFEFAAAAAGFKKKDRLDLGLILCKEPAAAAGVFTTNEFKAAPVLIGRETLDNAASVRGVVVNSGRANACTGPEGLEDCRKALKMTAKELSGKIKDLKPEEILPASTGVIGQRIQLDKWKDALPQLSDSLGKVGPEGFAQAIMTTDSFPKIASQEVVFKDGSRVSVLGAAKGAGMICPKMATMLAFVMTDAEVESDVLRAMTARSAAVTFNRVTVDGDTSTNDTLYCLASGASGVKIDKDKAAELEAGLDEVCGKLAYMLVQDAEGGTKVIHITVKNAATEADAERAAETVGNSPLVKTAMYGKDANWGRITAALGRSGARFDPDKVAVSVGGVLLFAHNKPADPEADAKLASHLDKRDIMVDIDLGAGSCEFTLLASDLTHEYVSINADYRT